MARYIARLHGEVWRHVRLDLPTDDPRDVTMLEVARSLGIASEEEPWRGLQMNHMLDTVGHAAILTRDSEGWSIVDVGRDDQRCQHCDGSGRLEVTAEKSEQAS